MTCQTLKISRSRYYEWKKNPFSRRKQEDKQLSQKIEKIHKDSRETYGAIRVQKDLRKDGETCGRNRVARIMKEKGLSGVARRRFRVMTTDSRHSLPIADRVFKMEEVKKQVTRPSEVWASDITYIATDEGWLYLAVVLDLYTRKVIGHSMASHMQTSLVMNALDMALGTQQRQKDLPLVGHSDRGSQYASRDYRERLESLTITASMSRKGNCYDNACVESFFHTLKVEHVYRKKFKTRDEAMQSIFEYIEVWYNRKRLHSSLGYQSPVEYEKNYYQPLALVA
jgi:transposase InsO family protein